jgi:FkbH-like protein
MHFSSGEIRAFAAWSRDHNPLHVDPAFARGTFFGTAIVHGMCSVVHALAEARVDAAAARTVEIEFRGAVTPDVTFVTSAVRAGDATVVRVADPAGAIVLEARALPRTSEPRLDTPTSWATLVPADATVRATPADRALDEIARLDEIVGRYRTEGPVGPGLADASVAPLHAQVYALASYLVGMDVPGLRSLFTRASIQFGEQTAAERELLYRVRVERVDQAFRLLDTQVDIASADGRLLATCALRSYVRFSPVVTDLGSLQTHVQALPLAAGTVALVVGGSRGLGADLAAALALAGAHVFVSYQHDESGATTLAARIAALGGRLDLVRGDAADAEWCTRTVASIGEGHGGLDVLVLNACAPPTPLAIGPGAGPAFQAYLQQNFALVEAPLAAALPALQARGGRVAYVSSSYVVEHPPRFGHYVALKQAGEALVTTAVRETSSLQGLILRPPPLQTAWNDTPTGAVGTIASDRVAVAFAQAVGTTVPGQTRMLDDFPALSRVTPAVDLRPLPLAIVASFTADPIEKSVAFWGRELGVAPELAFAPYGQILQSLFDPGSRLSTNGGGLNVVLLRVQDWLRELPRDRHADIAFLREHLEATSRDLVDAMRGHRARARAATLLVLCPSASGVEPDVADLLDSTDEALRSALAGVPGLQVTRAVDLHDAYAVNPAAIDDPLRDKIGHIPYTDAYFHVLGTVVMRHAWQRIATPRKVVVVDCDNTLWRGVVGEVGAEGLEFGEEHLRLQDTLAELSRNGVVICLCSKNVEDDVWRVFESRPDMRLTREHVVAAMINWRRKSDNLRDLAATLNLGLDAFVFLDDNPVECGEVRAGCPEVLTLQWPHDPAQALRLLTHLWELDVQGATAEDRKRTQMYREEFGRQSLRQGVGSFRDFLASLDLVVAVEPLTEADLARASQLTMRTNQFNFTTIRRDESEVRALLETGRHDIRTVRVRDRFGDYGLVGLLIAERTDGELLADTFLMSCRVLGRGAEHRMMAEFGRLAEANGLPVVRLRLEPTKRNAPARQFLETLAPDDLRGGDGVLDFTMPASTLAVLEYQPEDAEPEPVADDAPVVAATSLADEAIGDRQRAREAQIARVAGTLATQEGLARAIDGHGLAAAAQVETSVSREDVTRTVLEAFATSLDRPADDVARVDGLEALGCTSFRIVEITVQLMQVYPWLPNTLLFEHRAVSEIVDHIAQLAERRAARPGGDGRPGWEGRIAEAAAASASSAEAADTSHDIAVVGMDLRCAGARSPEELWALLSAGEVATRPVPTRRRFFSAPLEDARPHWAGLLDDLDQFDAGFFGISPREADLMDPQLRLFLQVAWGALEDANAVVGGVEPETGVFAGVMYDDYAHHANRLTRAAASPYKSWESFSLANRLSNVFGLRGPSLVVDTACSSSGTALHLACRALRDGDCRMAIVGGVNVILDPDRFAQLGRLGILSSTGRCLAFGKEADGTVLGEGIGVVVLRPLADAIARGDRIYGVIKGTGVSTGSGTVGFTAPNPQAQAVAIRKAVDASGVDPRTISYVETHGTATLLGDPIEVRGLTLGYGVEEGRGPVRASIGSIKPNIGHLEAGAAVLSLIKVLLQLHRRTLLPSVTSPEANPQIPFAQLPFTVQREPAPWVADSGPRRAAMSSFGVGGANVHVILEEAPAEAPAAAATAASDAAAPGALLVPLSARTDASLQAQAASLAEWIAAESAPALADIVHTLATTRRTFEQRAAIVAHDVDGLRQSLQRLAQGEADATTVRGAAYADVPRVAFLFTGQGAQYVGMGRQLYASQPVFRDAIDACAVHLDPLLGVSLVAVLHEVDDADAGRIDRTRFTQPALFAIEYALARLWQSWGVQPAAVVGHSVGEFAAMCIAGGLTLGDAARLIEARGRLMQALPVGGVMVSVSAPEARVRAAMAGVEDRVAIAGVNSPQQTILSGAREAVDEIVVALTAAGVRTRSLTVSHAFHSPLMRPMIEAFEAVVRSVEFRVPQIPIVSCVEGDFAPDVMTTPAYWTRQVLEPVRFLQAMTTLHGAGISAYLEIGPQPVLTGLGRQCLGADASAALWLPSIARDGDERATLLTSAAQLWVGGLQPDWGGIAAPASGRRASLPHYAFDTRAHWVAAAADGPAAMPVSQRLADVAIYGVEWRDIAVPTSTEESGTWVVLAATDAESEALVAALRDRGQACIVIPPDHRIDRAGLEAVLRGQVVRGVVHLRGLDAPAPARVSVATLEAWRRDALDSALAAAQAVAAVGGAVRLYVMTRGAVTGGADDAPLSLPQATEWGLGRTVALEVPGQWGGLIDLSATMTDVEQSIVVEWLLSGSVEDQVAVRQGSLRAARLVRRGPPSRGRFACHRDATYLVTGGMGALGLQVAEWLADRGARHLMLVGRQVRDTAAVEALRARGVSVTLAAANVADAAQVDGLLARIGGGTFPLKGMVHAAGVDLQVALEQASPEDLAQALDAKMAGAWLLHERTRALELDLFVMFSSLASVLGATGRAPYAAANAFLDALAIERRRQGLAALTVNWGPWAGAGMAAEGGTGDHFAVIGNHLIDPADAWPLLEVLLGGREAQAVVADLDWTRFAAAYQARRTRPFIAAMTAGGDRPVPVAPGARLSPADVADQVRGEVAQVLGFKTAADVPLDRGFFEMGLDSLSSVELATRLQQRFGVDCRGFVFDTPTVGLLGEKLARDVAARQASADGDAAPADGTSASTVVAAANALAAMPSPMTLYTPDMDEALFAFHTEAFGARRRADWVRPRWRWMFDASARRLGLEPKVWLYRDGERVVGHNGALPVRLQVGAATRDTAWLVETNVLEAFRARAIGPQLMDAAHDALPFALSLGQTETMRAILLKMGWQQVAPLQTAQLLLRPEKVLKGKLPPGAALGAGLGMRALSSIKRLGQSARAVSLHDVASYGAAHDALWASMAPTLGCGVVRDASYLTWKYVEQPGQQFFRFDVRQDDRLIGTTVWMLREADEAYRYRRAFLVDLVAPLDRPTDLEAMVQAGCARMREEGADAVLCLHVGGRLTEALTRSGFSRREPGRVLLVYPRGLSEAEAAIVLDGQQWLLTQGDSDIDRPW